MTDNPFLAILAELVAVDPLAYTLYRPKDRTENPYMLHLVCGQKQMVLRRTPDKRTIVQGTPDVDVTWVGARGAAEYVAEKLGKPLDPLPVTPPADLTPEQQALRQRLLPLARLAGANAYGAADPHPDPHLALRVIDGLHDEMSYVQGALDGLEVAVQLGLWELNELGNDVFDPVLNKYVRHAGPTPRNPQQDALPAPGTTPATA